MESKKYKIKVTKHTKIDGHFTYCLEIQYGKNTISVMKRYSELKTLNDLLRKETTSNNFPTFPPKKFFGFRTEEFVNKRQQDLNKYFQIIADSPEFSNLRSYIKFVENELNKNEALGGQSLRATRTVTYKQSKPKKMNINFVNNYEPRVFNNPEDIQKANELFKKIIDENKVKFISIDFQAEQNLSEESEKKYDNLIKNEKILENDNFKVSNLCSNINPGNDNNFDLIGINNFEINEIEKNIKVKMEDILKKFDNIPSIYDAKDIVATI